MPDQESDSSSYPPPLIIEPSSEHKESWIILHGRGDRAKSFAQGFMGLLNMPLPDGNTLQMHLPHVRFVFPTASYRRARVFSRATITQWFDLYSWNNTEKLEWQVEGLRETSAWIGELVGRECEIVGPANVVVGGLSQGCASVLIWNLLWTGQAVRCIFGMSGWLPFRHVLELFVPKDKANAPNEGIDVFENAEEKDPYGAAVEALCQELGVKTVCSKVGQNTPILITHGVEDEKVNLERGREAARCLQALGCNVTWTEYEGLSHWFNGNELLDVVSFVKEQGKRFDPNRV